MNRLANRYPVAAMFALRGRISLSLILLFVLVLGGCAPRSQEVTNVQPLEEPVAVDPKPQSAGSLWTGDEGNWLADVKARRVGDIVTVIIKEQAKASKQASTDTERSSSISAGISSFFGFEQALAEKNANLNPSSLIERSEERRVG